MESESTRTPTKERRLAALRRALREGSWRGAARMVGAMHPAEIALLIESLPPAQREVVWNFVEPEIEGDVLVELSEEVRQAVIDGMDAEELLAAAEDMELDDLADLVGDLPEAVGLQLVKSMDAQDRERLKTVLAFEPDTAGGLMNTDTVSVRADVTVEVVLRYLRMRGELPDKTDRLFVVDRDDLYRGTLALTRLLTEDPEKPVGDLIDPQAPRIAPATPSHDVTRLFQDRDLVSAAVVDDAGKLLGRITVDDVVDVIQEEAAHEVMSAAGLRDEEDVFAGIIPSTRRRLVWLGINLVTAFMASAVVSRFEGTIEKVAALAALMPIVASMGGIAGTQTVTLIIRGIALGQVEWVNAKWLLWKEIAVGGLNGMIWAVIVGAVTIVWYKTWKIAAIIAAATLINLLCAATVGVIVPLLLRRMRIDPALSAGVILTTFTDCIGFATLLGLGALFLTYAPAGHEAMHVNFPTLLRFLAALIPCALMGGGCTLMAPRYNVQVGNTLALRDAGIDKVRIGKIRKDPAAKRDVDKVRARAMTVASPYGSYTAYFQEALASEFDHADRLDAAAPITIDGVLLRNVLAAENGKEYAAIEAQLTITRDGRAAWQGTRSTRFEWDSAFLGEIAIPRAITNYQIGVQRLIAAFIADPEFVAALRKR